MTIVNNLNRRLPINIEHVIEKLLSKIPNEHLHGVNRIIITESKNNIKYAGLYTAGRNYSFKFSEIELDLSNIFWHNAYLIFLVPIIPKFLIANVLYHEIGHNFQKMVPGVKKESAEDFAEMYKNTFIDRAFPIFGTIRKIIFAPLYYLIRLSRKES